MVPELTLTFFGAFFFLYFYWKKLKDDYTQNLIFASGLHSLFGLLALGLVSIYLLPAWLFWLAILGSFFGLIAGILRYKMRRYETFEAWVLGIQSVLLFAAIYNFLRSPSAFNLMFALLVLVVLVLFFLVDKNYKKFTWYKSGRVGFTGLFMSGLMFLVIAIIAIFLQGMVFFQGIVGGIISSFLSLASFVTLFNLSRKHN